MMTDMLTLEECHKIWIYQASRPLTYGEVELIISRLDAFVKEWASHGNKLSATFEVRYNRFILIGVNENQSDASGCSIDSSVKVIRDLERELGISLLDKTKIAFDINGEIITVPFSKLKENVQAGKINSTNVLFDNSITQGSDLRGWKIAAGKSWMGRYFH